MADLLGVNESQVSRDERNEYHGITVILAKNYRRAMETSCFWLFEFDEDDRLYKACVSDVTETK